MFRNQHESTWPFLGLLLVLFVLSALSPRAWQTAIRDQAAIDATRSLAFDPGRPLTSLAEVTVRTNWTNVAEAQTPTANDPVNVFEPARAMSAAAGSAAEGFVATADRGGATRDLATLPEIPVPSMDDLAEARNAAPSGLPVAAAADANDVGDSDAAERGLDLGPQLASPAAPYAARMAHDALGGAQAGKSPWTPSAPRLMLVPVPMSGETPSFDAAPAPLKLIPVDARPQAETGTDAARGGSDWHSAPVSRGIPEAGSAPAAGKSASAGSKAASVSGEDSAKSARVGRRAMESVAMRPTRDAVQGAAQTKNVASAIEQFNATAGDLPDAAKDASAPATNDRGALDLPSAEPGEAALESRSRDPARRTAIAAQAPADNGGAWQEPALLFDLLDELAAAEPTRAWAQHTQAVVKRFGELARGASPEAAVALREIAARLGELPAVEARLHDRDLARKARQAGYALMRRHAIWSQLVEAQQSMAAAASNPRDAHSLAFAIAGVETALGNDADGLAWRNYVMLDALRDAARNVDRGQPLPSELATTVVARLSRPDMSARQRQFVESGPVAHLQDALRAAAAPGGAKAVDLNGVLAHLERYETSRLPSDAREVAGDCLALAAAPIAAERAMASQVQTHYRNANVRIAVSESLLNRMMPQRAPEMMPVYDSILGQPVRGRSLLSTELAVRLLPDPHRLRLALEVNGEIVSATSSSAGPATFHNTGSAVYSAVRPMEIDMRGIRLEDVDVAVQNDTRLQSVETDLDGVPLVGSLVRGVAKQQYDMNLPNANREVRWKISRQAQQRVEEDSTERLTEFARRFHAKVLSPLYTLRLDPTIVDAETTAQRMTMRLRLAGSDQLGAHSPRPQAPSDSLASFQVHESALNNALERLDLNGHTYQLPDLIKDLSQRLGNQGLWETNAENEDVQITFAVHDAVRVACENEQIALTLSIAKLSKGQRSWSDFQARAFYRPAADGVRIELRREGVVQLVGARNFGSQIALRGIFAKVFSRKNGLPLTPESLEKNAALADLAVTQFTVEDGWIGVALGPKRTASAASAVRR